MTCHKSLESTDALSSGLARLSLILRMNAIEKAESLRRKFCTDAQFIEGWKWGTYVVAGIFAIPTENLTVTELQNNIPILYSITKEAKQGWWPRGVSGTFLFPFYLSTDFDPAVLTWVQSRQPYRWAIWHEPVLYDISRNSVWMRSDYGHFGSAFYPLVFGLYRRALTIISERLQRPGPEFINGVPTNNRSA